MSQFNNDKLETPLGSAKTADDIFAELSKDDDQETLDLTKPLKEKEKKASGNDDPDVDRKDDDKEDDDKQDDKEEEEVDELKLLEEDLEEPDDEKLELVTPVARREILKKYPNLFKEFPYLEKAYYREQQYTELLPTIDDAKEAVESHKVLARYTEDMVEKGNVQNVLKMIKDNNPETYAQVVDNYMDHLERIDPAAHLHVQSNLVKNIIIGMVDEAKASNDDDLRTAALLLNKWAFGSAKFTPPQKMAKDLKPEEKEKESAISQREKEFAQRQLDNAVGEVNTRVNNAIKGAIENNIDPKGSMTDYVRRNAVRDASEKITALISKDTRFQKIVDKLWEKSEKAGYSKETQDEIRKAFLSKAKSLLAPVLKSARNEALKGMGKRVKEDDDAVDDDNTDKPQREKVKNTEPRLSSDRKKATLDSVRGKSSYEALQTLMGD